MTVPAGLMLCTSEDTVWQGSRRDAVTVARRFNAGTHGRTGVIRPAGTGERPAAHRARQRYVGVPYSGVRASLRDGTRPVPQESRRGAVITARARHHLTLPGHLDQLRGIKTKNR